MSFFEPVELTADPIAAYQFTQQLPLPQTNRQAQVNGNLGDVVLLIFFVMTYILSACCYKKYRQQQELIRAQQIEMLERMWTISPNR